MAKKSYRIVIPTDTQEYKELIDNIDKQNDKLGDDSPVKSQTAEIKKGVKNMAEADKLDQEAAALKRKAEKLIERRNKLQRNVTLPNERGWRKTLEGAYIKAIHKMGDFGYEIDTSPRKKKEK